MPNLNYRVCLNCEQEFTANSATQKFCDRHCGRAYRDKILNNCKLCGEPFIGSVSHNTNYCSQSCASKANNWIHSGRLKEFEIGILCPECRKPLEHRSNRKSLFCSHSCAATANARSAPARSKAMAICHPERHNVSNGLCQQCWAKKYNVENKERLQITSRDLRLRKRFGITTEQWDLLFEQQKGLCPICLKPILKPNDPSGKRAAAVDHDHKTGRVRGLVHDRCNRFFISNNTIETAERLVAYLKSTLDGRDL